MLVGGGSGTRMGSELPKQFMMLNGLPVILRSAKIFIDELPEIQMIFVVPEAHIQTMKDLCFDFELRRNFVITAGGPTRFHSVKNGLKMIDEADNESVIAIHDSVRPLLDNLVFFKCMQGALLYGNAIPVVPVHESVRIKDGPLNRPADRSKLVLVQTPQCFKISLIKKAYEVPYDEKFTDDATVAENAGIHIRLVDGNPENIKLTTPADFKYAQSLLKQFK